MKNRIITILFASLLLLSCHVVYYGPYPTSTEYIYYGHHPIPAYIGGGMCYIEGRHIHSYPPENTYSFYYYEGTYFYIGTTVSYFGPHPIPSHFGGGICMINEYHTHNYYPYGSGYVYYPDDNVFVYVDVDINVPNRKPYQPRNRHGEYSSGVPYSDKSGKHEYTPNSQGGSTTQGSNSHGHSNGPSGGASRGPGYPSIDNPQRPNNSYTPKKFEPSNTQPTINTPSQTNKRIEPYKPQINTPADTNRQLDFDNHPTINTPSQTNKKFEPSNTQPTINTPSQTNKRIEPYKPQINTPSNTDRRRDFNKTPQKYDVPSHKRFTPQDTHKKDKPERKNFPQIDTKKKKGATTEDDEEANKIKKVYKKDEIKIPGVNKKIPGPDQVSK